MDAVVIAGGRPDTGEPLYEFTQGGYKALLDIAGKPMAQWVLDALTEAETIDRVIVIGLPEDCGVISPKVVEYVPSQGDLLKNVRIGINNVIEHNPEAGQMLIVSSDIPAITSEMVNWLVETIQKTDFDIYYNVIPRQVMEDRFPSSNRSYTHLKDVEVCGGDMNAIHARMAKREEDIWKRVLDSRKNVFKQAALIGYDTLLLLLLRQITIDGAVKRVTSRLDITGQAIICPYAELGMDVDKPHQLEILRADLAQRAMA